MNEDMKHTSLLKLLLCRNLYNRIVPIIVIIIVDNILFHGCVENQEGLTKNVRNMVKKIDQYNNSLINLTNYDSYFLPVGDGQAILVKRG